MKMSFDKVERAFINEDITLEQFIQILVDNFGPRKTRQILRRNLEIAKKKEHCKDQTLQCQSK